MAVYVTLNLLPAQAAPARRTRTPEAEYLRRLAAAYSRAASSVARLERDGWECDADFISVFARHPDVKTRAQARRRLTELGIDPGKIEVEATLGVRAVRKLLSRRAS